MTDFATLGMKIDSTQVKQGVGELDKLTAAGTRAEGSINKLGTAAAGAGAQVKTATGSAALYAAEAQRSAAAAMGMSAGATTAGAAFGQLAGHASGASLQIREMMVLMREASRGNFTRMAGSVSILASSLQTTGSSLGSVITGLLKMAGIIKTTGDAEASATAASAAAFQQAIAGHYQQAQSAILAADAEMALAQAQQRVAVTAAEQTAAQAAQAAAQEAIAAASAQAVIAANALTAANEEVAVTASQAAAAETTALAPLGVGLLAITAIAGVAFGAFKKFQEQVKDSGELTRYRDNLGLTHKEMLELSDGVDKVGDHIKKLTDVTVSAGDVMAGLWKTIADDASNSAGSKAWSTIKNAASSAFSGIIAGWGIVAAALTAGIYGTFNAVKVIWGSFPSVFGDIFVSGVNAAITALNKLLKFSTDGINAFISATNAVFGTKLGQLQAPQLQLVDNKSAGAALRTIKDIGNGYADAYAQARKSDQAFWNQVGKNAIQHKKDRLRDEADALIADRAPKKGRKQSDHGLAEALAELDAQIKGQLALAQAYQVSDAAAIKAEAMQKAEEQAIRHKGEVGVFYEKELALAVATRAAEGAKAINQLSGQTAAQKAVNDAVAAGTMTVEAANAALKNEAQIRPLLAAQAVAEGKAKDDLTKIIARLREEQAAANAEANRAAVLSATANAGNDLERLRLEARLIGETNAVRSVALAQLAAEQYLRAHPGATATEEQAYVDAMKQIARVTADNATAQDNYNASLSYMADLLALIDERTNVIATSLSSAFGNVGTGLGQAITALSHYDAVQAKIDLDHRARLKLIGNDEKALAQEQALYAQKSGTAQLTATMQLVGGLKTLFKEHSAGYRAMEAAERALAIIQLVQTAKSVAAGAAKMFATLGPFAFPAVAAMLAVMASLGFGGGGTSSQPAPPSPEDLQKQAGTGSVLGDSSAKSESIANSLQIVAANTNRDLEYSSSMLRSLRAIESNTAKLAGVVAQQIKVSGSLFDTSKLKLGTSGSSGFLGLFASSTTKTLYDLGIKLATSSVADILAKGISGQTYQTVETVKKKSGFLGIGGGTKTTYQTTTGTIDPQITEAIGNVISSLRDGIVSASKVIGLDGADAILNSFQVALGTISFQGMTGKEIEDQLNAIFSKVGDDMAAAVLPALTEIQKVGEGLFETFVRVAREYEVVDTSLKSIGKEFGAVGVSSIAARDALVQMFNSLDDFVEQTNYFREHFLSDAEQIAPVADAVRKEMVRLGLAGVVTRDQFKQTVLGLDLTTAAGREMYAALLSVAPAFDKTIAYFEQLNKATADGLKSTIDQFSKFADGLKKYRDTLFATDTAQTGAYAVLKARFAATADLASQGDATALGGLQDAGKTFLDAAKNNASSLQQYQRDVALVAQGVDKGIFAAESVADYAQLQLDALSNAVTILGSIDANVAATAAALGAPAQQPASPTTPAGVTPAPTTPAAPTNDAMVTELQGLRQQAQAQGETINRLERLFNRWDGDGLLIRTDVDEPLHVVTP